MNRFTSGFVFLTLASVTVSGTHFHGDSKSNDRIEAAAAAMLGLAEAGSIPAPAQLQVLRLPADPTRGEVPPWGDQELTTAVLDHLGGNIRGNGPSLATCERTRQPTVGVHCQFPEGNPVGVRVDALGPVRGVVVVVIIEPTEDPVMPLSVTAYRVSVSRGPSAAWRFTGVLSEEPAQVDWRALATVKP